MTTFRYGRTSAVALDKLDASLFINTAGYSTKLGNAEVTHFQSQAKEFVVGLAEGTLTLSGMFDATNSVTQPTVTSADATLDAMIPGTGPYPVTMAFDGGFAAGRRVLIATAFMANYTPGSALGGVANVKVDMTCTNRPMDGYALTAYAPITTAGAVTGAAVDNGATAGATANGLVWTVHVPANTWSVPTPVKIQHSTDNVTWVDLATQSVPATTQTAYTIAVAGTVNRYVRSLITTAAGTGAITVLSAFARN